MGREKIPKHWKMRMDTPLFKNEITVVVIITKRSSF